MAELRRIQMSLFLMLMLLRFGATAKRYSSFMVKDGEDVTLLSKMTTDQDRCGRTTWEVTGPRSGPVELVKHGQISEKAKDRLSLTQNCSLVIKKVTVEDAGLYICRQDKSGISELYLHVMNMTEEKDDDKVTLSCSVSSLNVCRHKVKWLFQGEDGEVVTAAQSQCSATVTFPTSLTEKSGYSELFRCEVLDDHSGKVQLFTFSPGSSDEVGKEETTKTPSVKPTTEATPAVKSSPAATPETNVVSTVFPSLCHCSPWDLWGLSLKGLLHGWWALVVSPVVLVTLVFVVFVGRRGAKRKKMQVDPDATDPEDGVSYTSIRFNRKTDSKPWVQGDDGDDAVTYTTVNVPSTDPSDFNTTTNNPNT